MCSAAYLETVGPIKSIADFAKCELIHIMGYEDMWMSLFRSAGLAELPRDRGIIVDTTLAALEVAASGLGCVMTLRSSTVLFLETGRLVRPLACELPLEQSHYLLLPEDGARPRPEALIFREWLAEEVKGDPR